MQLLKDADRDDLKENGPSGETEKRIQPPRQANPGRAFALAPYLWFTILYLAVRLPWLLCLPTAEAPDEGNHLWVAQFLHDHLRLPSAAEVHAAGGAAEYGSIPQFGYVPHVLLTLLIPWAPFPTVARFGTLLAGLPTAWLSVALGKKVFPQSQFLALALPLLVVLHPQLIFTQSYVNTDGTVISLTSAAILLAVTALSQGMTKSRAALIGFLMAWAALSKHNSLALLPALVGATIYAGVLHAASTAVILTRLAILAAVLLVGTAWWFARNYVEFNGDVLGSRTMIETWSQILPRKNGQIVNPWPPLASLSWWRFLFFDFWGLFGYMTRYLWRPLYIAFGIICGASLWGWVKPHRSVQRQIGQRQEHDALRQEQKTERAIWLFLTSCVLLSLASAVYVTISNVSGPHGRYLFVSELPLAALILAGFARLPWKACRVLTVLTICLCLISSVSAWLMYYAP